MMATLPANTKTNNNDNHDNNNEFGTGQLDDELNIPKYTTLQPKTIRTCLVTTTTRVSIPLTPETCNRTNGRCWIVGRQASASDIRIQHKSISRKHAVLYAVDGGENGSSHGKLYIQDFGGKHGTTINNQRIPADTAVELHDGDTILFGNVRESVFRVKITPTTIDGTGISTSDENDNVAAEPLSSSSSQQQQQQQQEGKQRIDAQTLLEKAGEGLTGREKRQAEIEAMMNSLDETPVYQKHTNPVEATAASDKLHEKDAMTNPAELNAIESVISKHNLPITNRLLVPSESERKNSATCLAIDPNGARFVVGSTDTRLRLYDFGGMDRNKTDCFKVIIPDDGYLLVDCAFSNTGDRILVGTSSVQPRVFGRDGDEIMKFVRGDMYVTDQAKTVGHTAAVTSVDWHPLERDLVLTSSNDGSARIWNLNGKTQFQMLVCDKVFQAKSERGQRTAVKSVCFHPGGREFALGTACGSIQIWSRLRVSGRPERAVYNAHDGTHPITSLAYSIDGTRLISRSAEDNTARIWDALRLSRSTTPSAICTGLETVHDNTNACLSPNAKIVCAGSSLYQKDSTTGKRVEVGSLNFYCISEVSSKPKPIVEPMLCSKLDGQSTPVVVKWHHTLNQIFVTCSDGGVIVFYDPVQSTKGALLPARKAGRGVDGLSELLRSRAPQGSAAMVSGTIVTPFSLPMYRENTVCEKKRKRDERKDPILSKEPERPVTGKHKTGTQAGTSLSFQQFVSDQTTVKKNKSIAGKDPREALFKYSKDDKKDESRILADKTAEEEEEQLHSKK